MDVCTCRFGCVSAVVVHGEIHMEICEDSNNEEKETKLQENETKVQVEEEEAACTEPKKKVLTSGMAIEDVVQLKYVARAESCIWHERRLDNLFRARRRGQVVCPRRDSDSMQSTDTRPMQECWRYQKHDPEEMSEAPFFWNRTSVRPLVLSTLSTRQMPAVEIDETRAKSLGVDRSRVFRRSGSACCLTQKSV
eukprot:2647065-Rhodomonas_salina.1